MSIPGPLCAMTRDGAHKLKPFHVERSGMVCVACNRCWFFEGETLVPFTHADVKIPASLGKGGVRGV